MLFTAEEYIAIANTFYQNGEYVSANNAIDRSLNLQEDLSEAWLIKGKLAHEAREFNLAAQCYTKSLELDKANADTHYHFGLLYKYFGHYETAITYIEEAIQLAEDYVDDYYKLLAKLYYQIHDFEKSIEICDHIRADFFDDSTAYYYKFNALLRLKRYKEATDVCEKYTHVDLYSAAAQNNYGYCLLLMGEYRKAIPIFELALSYDPENTYAHNNFGYAMFKTDYVDEGLQSVHYAIQCDITNCMAYRNRAITLLFIGLRDEAKSDLLRAKELNYAALYDSEVDDLLTREFSIPTNA